MTAGESLLSAPVAAVFAELRQELERLPSATRMSEQEAAAVYSLAYGEFNRARYEEALRYFLLLLVYRPSDKVYLLGGALCLQRLRRYPLAIAAFTALSFMEPDEPGHTLAVAECQLLCNEHAEAVRTLRIALAACQGKPAHDRVRLRAEAILELMRPHHESVPA